MTMEGSNDLLMEWTEKVLHGSMALKVTVMAEIGIHRTNCRAVTEVSQYCFTKTCDPCEIILRANLLDDNRWAAHLTLMHYQAHEKGEDEAEDRVHVTDSRLRRKNARQPIFFFNRRDDWVKILSVQTSREMVW